MAALASPITETTARLQHCLLSVMRLSQHASAQGLTPPEKTSSWNVSMIPQPTHPWLPQKMVLGGLPLVEEPILLVLDAPFAAEELDAVLEDQLPTAHQLIVGLLFWTGLCLFLAHDARVAAQHVETASFATGRAIEPVACHAAAILIA